MDFEERKNGIIDWVAQISSVEVLEKIEQLKEEEDWFDSLPLKVQESILEAKQQGEDGLFMDPLTQEKKLNDLL